MLFTALSLVLATTAFANYAPPIQPYEAQSHITCYSAPPTTFTARQTFTDPMACLLTCGSDSNVSAFLQKAAGGYDCLCAKETDIVSLPGGVCDENGWYVYTPYPKEEGSDAVAADTALVTSNVIVTPAKAGIEAFAEPPVDGPATDSYTYKRRSRIMRQL